MIYYSSNYRTLYSAISNMKNHDELIIDNDCVIDSTIEINKRDIIIHGCKCIIKILTEDPIFRIINNSKDSCLWNIKISDIIFKTSYCTGYGKGTAIEIVDDKTVNGGTSSIKISDVNIENFETGISIINAHNIFIENCLINGNDCGIKIKSEEGRVAGQIKIFGGYFICNRNHICIEGENKINGLYATGWTCGGQRCDENGNSVITGENSGSIGLYSNAPAEINFNSCHFEDLDYAIKLNTNFVNSVVINGGFAVGINKSLIFSLGDIKCLSIIGIAFSNNDINLLNIGGNITDGKIIAGNYKSKDFNYQLLNQYYPPWYISLIIIFITLLTIWGILSY